MKEQRQKLIDTSIETELADVQGAQSRFVDLGFVRPVQGQVRDTANDFINAVKTTTQLIAQSDYSKDNVSKDKMRASVQARQDYDAQIALVSQQEQDGVQAGSPMTGGQMAGQHVNGLESDVLALEGKSDAYQNAYKAQRTAYALQSIGAHNAQENKVVEDNTSDLASAGVTADLNNDTAGSKKLSETFKDFQDIQPNKSNKAKLTEFVGLVNTKVKQMEVTYTADLAVYLGKYNEEYKSQLASQSNKLTAVERADLDKKITAGSKGLGVRAATIYRNQANAQAFQTKIVNATKAAIELSGVKSPEDRYTTLKGDLDALERSDGAGKVMDFTDASMLTLKTSLNALTDTITFNNHSMNYRAEGIDNKSVDDAIEKAQSATGAALTDSQKQQMRQITKTTVSDTMTNLFDGDPATHPISLNRVSNILALNNRDAEVVGVVTQQVDGLVQKMRSGEINHANMMPYLQQTLGGDKKKKSVLWQTAQKNSTFRALSLAYSLNKAEQYGDEIIGLDTNDFTDGGLFKIPGQDKDARTANEVIARDILTDVIVAPSQISDHINMINYFLSRGEDEDEIREHLKANSRHDAGAVNPGFKFDGNVELPTALLSVVAQDMRLMDGTANAVSPREQPGIVANALFFFIESNHKDQFVNEEGWSTYDDVINTGFEEDGETRITETRNRLDWTDASLDWKQVSPDTYQIIISRGDTKSYITVDEQDLESMVQQSVDRAVINRRSTSINESYYKGGFQGKGTGGSIVTGAEILSGKKVLKTGKTVDVDQSPSIVGPSRRWVDDLLGKQGEEMLENTRDVYKNRKWQTDTLTNEIKAWWDDTGDYAD